MRAALNTQLIRSRDDAASAARVRLIVGRNSIVNMALSIKLLLQLDSTLFMSSVNVSHELTSPNDMWSSILMLTLLSNVMMNAVLLSDSAFIEAYLPIASRKIQIREREDRS